MNNGNKLHTKDKNTQKPKVKIKNIHVLGLYIIKLLLIVACIIFVLLFFKEVAEYKEVFFTYNAMEQIEDMYKGKFTLLYPEINAKEMNTTPDGYYRFKDKNGIIFNAYKTGSILTADYDQFLIKEFVNQYIEKEKKENIIRKEEFYDYNGHEFFRFSFGVKINDYSQIEETVKELTCVSRFINKKAQRIFDSPTKPIPTYYPEIYLNDFIGKTGYDVGFYNDDDYIRKVKIDYINYLHQNNLDDENVPDKDFVDYYRPEEMAIYMNGSRLIAFHNQQHVSVFAPYSIKDNDYFIQLFYLIRDMKNVDSYEFNQFGKLLRFNYKGKEYILDSDLNLKKEIKGNRVSYELTVSDFVEFFDGDVEYDYENKIINLNV